jgi:lysozyme
MMIPKSTPKQSKEKSLSMIKKAGITANVVLLGIRGYYSETFPPAGNQRGIYDDAIFLVSPEAYVSYNANTDPTVYRKGIASLVPGVHIYKKGKHGISKGPGYPALRPATKDEALPVYRDGEGISIGYNINIHRGGKSTSSLGCQTIPASQYDSFISLVYDQMDRFSQKTIPYLLIEA